jgi:predicted chitinase
MLDNQKKIANNMNRMGNGDEKSGEPSKFIGRGALQLTGKKIINCFQISLVKIVKKSRFGC